MKIFHDGDIIPNCPYNGCKDDRGVRLSFPLIDWTKVELNHAALVSRRKAEMKKFTDEWGAFDFENPFVNTDPYITNGCRNLGACWTREQLFDLAKLPTYHIKCYEQLADMDAWNFSDASEGEDREDLHRLGAVNYHDIPENILIAARRMNKPIIMRFHYRMVNSVYHRYFLPNGMIDTSRKFKK